ncbi:MAG: hypothetical protein ACK559_11580, partial [bacterium]
VRVRFGGALSILGGRGLGGAVGATLERRILDGRAAPDDEDDRGGQGSERGGEGLRRRRTKHEEPPLGPAFSCAGLRGRTSIVSAPTVGEATLSGP